MNNLINQIQKITPQKLSPFWKTQNLQEGEHVYVRRLGPAYEDKEFRGIIRGYYGCDVEGNPDAYIVEMIDKIPGGSLPGHFMSCHVFTRACVDSTKDLNIKDERLIEYGGDKERF